MRCNEIFNAFKLTWKNLKQVAANIYVLVSKLDFIDILKTWHDQKLY